MNELRTININGQKPAGQDRSELHTTNYGSFVKNYHSQFTYHPVPTEVGEIHNVSLPYAFFK